MIFNNILEAMGNTPMIRLQRMVDDDSAEVLVKFEGLNVGGSTKTRTACAMIEEAERQGLLNRIPLSLSLPAAIRASVLPLWVR